MKKFFALFLIVLLIPYCLCGYYIFQVVTHPQKYQNEICEFSIKYDIPCELIASIINVESSYNKNAKSKKNAIGLMQVKLTTANYLDDLMNRERISEIELYSPSVNINYGTEYLKYLSKKFKNIDTAICAYNAGETIVRSWLRNNNYSEDGNTLKIIPFNETKNYLINIKKNIEFYKKIYKFN